MYLYKEGLFVRGAAPLLAEIVGAQVMRIGELAATFDVVLGVTPER